MGDYETVTSEFLGTKAGFFGAWGDNTAGTPTSAAPSSEVA
jgi:hypothetical protein